MKIVIVGGVAAGMSAAARARRLDENAEIVVIERGDYVSFANCGLPYHIGGMIQQREKLLVQTPPRLRAMLNLDVRTRQEVVGIQREEKCVTVRHQGSDETYTEAYDHLVLCPGARAVIPPIPGVGDDRVCVLRNVADMDQILKLINKGCESAVVVGGGYIGIEAAENLVERGIETHLVERLDSLMPTALDPDMAAFAREEMQARGVKLHLGCAVKAIAPLPDRLEIDISNGAMLPAELVIMAVGVRPEVELAEKAGLQLGPRGGIAVDEKLRTSDPSILAAGDAVEVVHHVCGTPALIPLAGPANRQGRMAADSIYGRRLQLPTTKGTAIVKVFGLTVAATGASESVLKSIGQDYRKVYVHPANHAGYYPGATQMHIKALFSPENGKLLGAQIVGRDGVDKRIDVLATALYAGLTVRDLAQLELAYAPPYGSAKDPVNMVGFVGENLLEAQVEFWYAEQYPDASQQGVILDVRTDPEYAEWHIPGAQHIPLGSLRERLGELDKTTPVFTYCTVGFRSYLAYRILAQNGFEQVRTLAGGSITFRCVNG